MSFPVHKKTDSAASICSFIDILLEQNAQHVKYTALSLRCVWTTFSFCLSLSPWNVHFNFVRTSYASPNDVFVDSWCGSHYFSHLILSLIRFTHCSAWTKISSNLARRLAWRFRISVPCASASSLVIVFFFKCMNIARKRRYFSSSFSMSRTFSKKSKAFVTSKTGSWNMLASIYSADRNGSDDR